MSRRADWLLPIAAALLAVLAVIALAWLQAATTSNLEVFGTAPTFTLIDDQERSIASDDLRGKVVLANFIYTNCQDICPLLSIRMQAVQERLRGDGLLGTQVQLLSFSVDPARDTPSVLRAYAERHGADPSAWRFLTGHPEQLIPLIVDGFHLGVDALPPAVAQAEPNGGHEHPYEVMHSGRFVLIDREWRIRAFYDGRDLDLERVARDLHQLLG